jgi:hypothetical protein
MPVPAGELAMGDVIDIGRNAPCPCGSGRKFKRCCGRDAAPRSPGRALPQRLRDAEMRLVAKISAWVLETYGPDVFDAGWCEFLPEMEEDELGSDSEQFQAFFGSWALFAWDPGLEADEDDDVAGAWPTQPLAMEFLDAHPDRVDPLEERLLDAACSRPFSFHQVLRVERDRGLELRDLVSAETRFVTERLATESLALGEILFARTLAIDDAAILLGCAPIVIPPTYAPRIFDLRDKLAMGGGLLPIEEIRDLDDEFRFIYFAFAAEVLHPQPPELRNTDGDPFVLLQLRYALHCPVEFAFEKLKVLAVGHTAADLLADAERDEQGGLLSVEFPWLVKGNKQHTHWDNTVLGRVVIDRGVLTVEVNSRRRARRIRKRIENRLRGVAAFEGEVAQSAEELFEAARASGEDLDERAVRREQERLASDPVAREFMERTRREHWERWLDLDVPALDGKTPRAAARDPRLRERLEALLLEFEWRNARPGNEMAPDVGALRRELGI